MQYYRIYAPSLVLGRGQFFIRDENVKTVKGVLANLGERFVAMVGKDETETKRERTKRGFSSFEKKYDSLKGELL